MCSKMQAADVENGSVWCRVGHKCHWSFCGQHQAPCRPWALRNDYAFSWSTCHTSRLLLTGQSGFDCTQNEGWPCGLHASLEGSHNCRNNRWCACKAHAHAPLSLNAKRTVNHRADSSTELTDRPRAHEDEVQFVLDAISEYLTVKVRRSDVLSTWAGIRPLAQDPNASNTESASRDHIITRDDDGLLTVTGSQPSPYTDNSDT